MTGAKRPTIFKFADHLVKDAAIMRAKIIDCKAGKEPAPQKKKDAAREKALKQCVLNYIEAAKKDEAEEMAKISSIDEVDSDDQMNSDDETATNQWSRTDESERDKWLKSPEMTLMSTIAHHARV